MNIGDNNKIKNSNFADGNITVENSKKENKIVWKIVIPIIVGVVSTIIATALILVLKLQ